MPVYIPEGEAAWFPPCAAASPEGVLAVGGDLSLPRLLAAYRQGIFPWYGEDTPIIWWNLPERSVLFPESLHIPRSLRRVINARQFHITLDTAFSDVIHNCAHSTTRNENGTWIVPEMQVAYTALHHAGYAHSVEAWEEGRLVGGLYGLALGKAFFGESMFYRHAGASKVALVWLVRYLQARNFSLLDCQQETPNTNRFGARVIPRTIFMCHLKDALSYPDHTGTWMMPPEFFPL